MSFSDIPDAILRVGAEFSGFKGWFESVLPFHDDALHVAIGVVLQWVGAIILRSTIARWRPWIFVAVMELANEANDLFAQGWGSERGVGQGAYASGLMDIALTMALPTLLLFAARATPRVMSGR